MTASLASVLLVDYDESNRRLLEGQLHAERYAVTTAARGKDALELISARNFDIVLLAMGMPDQDGQKTLSEIRKSKSTTELPVIMLTANSLSDELAETFELGANDYLTKPVHFPVALARISGQLTTRRSARMSQFSASKPSDLSLCGKSVDPLTGLPNREQFVNQLKAAIHLFRDSNSRQFAILHLDLDRFQVINDSLGHAAGDQLLVTVARRLESCLCSPNALQHLGAHCAIARFNGDEFAVLLTDLTTENTAADTADRILSVLSQPIPLYGQEVFASASIGIVFSNSSCDTTEDFLHAADTAMYRAKVEGKARYAVFDQSMRRKAVARLELETDLRRGLDREEFRLHYQPIVALSTGRIEGFEALLRWEHSTRGLISPAEFIPVAEESGQIISLGAWVLREACRKVQTWQVEFPQEPPLFMSVNLSSRQFADPGLVDKVIRALDEANLDSASLNLEITESAILQDPEAAAETLSNLRTVGVRISVDDFGTGYSALSYLKQFAIDTLKIDRSFVDRLNGSHQAYETVQTIVNLAHMLGMEVTAEGIEQSQQQSALLETACKYGQGYLYSRPVAEEIIESLLMINQQQPV